MSVEEQEKFQEEAEKIAAGFEHEIYPLKFRDGILFSTQVKEGDRCDYTLSSGFSGNVYGLHNVDTPTQAAALHGITTRYINNRRNLLT